MKKYVVYTDINPCIGYFTHTPLEGVKAYVKFLTETENIPGVKYKEVNDDYIPESKNYYDDFGVRLEFCK